MKRLLIISVLLLSVIGANAQSSSYKGFIETGGGFYFGSKSGGTLVFNTSHGKAFGNIFLGGGTGIERLWIKNGSYIKDYVSEDGWDGWIGTKVFKGVNVPVFANIKGIWDNNKISPTFDVKAGLNLGYAFGSFGEAGTGCRFDLGKTALAATIFFKAVNEGQNMVTDDPKYADGWFTSAGVKVAFEF